MACLQMPIKHAKNPTASADSIYSFTIKTSSVYGTSKIKNFLYNLQLFPFTVINDSMYILVGER